MKFTAVISALLAANALGVAALPDPDAGNLANAAGPKQKPTKRTELNSLFKKRHDDDDDDIPGLFRPWPRPPPSSSTGRLRPFKRESDGLFRREQADDDDDGFRLFTKRPRPQPEPYTPDQNGSPPGSPTGRRRPFKREQADDDDDDGTVINPPYTPDQNGSPVGSPRPRQRFRPWRRAPTNGFFTGKLAGEA